MIVTLTPNPALDITYRVGELAVGETHRVGTPARRAGGKGLNTASVLAQLGQPHVAVAAVDEQVARWWGENLRLRGVRSREVSVDGGFRTRSSIALVDDDGVATVLNEGGNDPGDRVWAELSQTVLEELGPGPSAPPPAAVADPAGFPPGQCSAGGPPVHPVLAVCGSLPFGAHVDPLLSLVADAQHHGATIVVDGTGPWLSAVLPLRPAMVKSNKAEAEATTGLVDPVDAARAMVEAGAASALVSLGSDGVLLVQGDGAVHRARPEESLQGNPTGAGDAATAAVCAHLARQLSPDPEALLRDVVGWSAAAVLSPLAGDVAVDRVRALARATIYSSPSTQEP